MNSCGYIQSYPYTPTTSIYELLLNVLENVTYQHHFVYCNELSTFKDNELVCSRDKINCMIQLPNNN